MAVNIEAWSKKIKKFGQDTMSEVQKMNEIRQLTSRVNEEKKKINTVYTEIGKKLYELYKETPFEGFEAEFHSIEEKVTLIDLLQDQIRGVKGVVLCECCNTEVGVGEHFCSNCGNRMPEVPVLEAKEADGLEDETVEEADIVEEVEAAEEVTEEAEAAEEVIEEAEAAEEVTEEAEAAEEAAEDAETAEEVTEEAEAVEEVTEVVEAADEMAESAAAEKN